MLTNIRFGFRMLRKSAASSLLAVLSLALGIGAATAIFSVVNGVLLEPFPYKGFDRMMLLRLQPLKGSGLRPMHSISEYLRIREQNQVFEDVFAMGFEELRFTDMDNPELVSGKLLSNNAFTFLGVQPLLGRTFVENDYAGGGEPEPVAILSYLLWQRRFGGDPKIVGQTIRLNNKSYTVVGVMPSRFTLYTSPNQHSIWLPLSLDRTRNQPLIVHGRLKLGISQERASAELLPIYKSLAEEDPKNFPQGGFTVSLRPFTEWVTSWIRNTVNILVAAIGFLLLIACANAANLLLARSTARRKEIAVRVAVGARPADLLRQLLTESVLLSLAGGALGIVLAYWGTKALVVLLPLGSLPSEAVIHMNGRALLFSFGLSVLTGILFGLAPALHAARGDPSETLRGAEKGSTRGHHGDRTRSVLVTAAVASSMILLVGAGLMLHTFIKLQQEKLGFEPANVLTMFMPLPQVRYSKAEQRNDFYRGVIERVQALPGVRAATITSSFPPYAVETVFEIEGQPRSDEPKAAFQLVGSGYLSTMGLRLLRGRGISERDVVDLEHVAVISESLAAGFFRDGKDPLGKHIRLARLGTRPPGVALPREANPWCQIIGVAGDVKNSGLREKPRPAAYVPYTLIPTMASGLAVRTASNPMQLLKAVRSQIQAIDKDQPVVFVNTLEERLATETAGARFTTLLFGVFAVVGLVLAATGVYGVMAYSVSQRTHEVGIRLALGAQTGDVLRLVLFSGMKLILIGAAVGILGSVLLSRFIASQLYGVTATDPAVFGIVSLILIVVGIAACYLPARRATRLDPLLALHRE